MAAKREDLDPYVTYAQQLEQVTGPVVFVNVFTVDPSEAERFLEHWRDDAAFMKRQPGYISAQMHRGIAGSGTFVVVAAWESAAALAAAVRSPEFQALIAHYPDGTVARPHLFAKVAVPGICVA